MIPQALLDHASKKSGLICVAGDRHSQIDRTLSELTQSLSKSSSLSSTKGALVLRQSPRPYQIGSPFLLVQYGELDQPLVQKSISESDYLIFERMMDFEELEWALHLAEEGRMVIIHMATNSLISLLHRVFSMWPVAQKVHWLWRFADNLQFLFNQVSVPSLVPASAEGDGRNNVQGKAITWAYEMALATPNIKKCIRDGDLTQFEAELNGLEERSGLLSLNQSLLQLLIQRKIDISTAFEATRDPEGLDNMLKKVGI